jgi:hypothetical protein|tara:strand:- start:664 stop:795 length:132 start_codon:yes stop_codon:yes gene_type:complete
MIPFIKPNINTVSINIATLRVNGEFVPSKIERLEKYNIKPRTP